MTCSSLPVDEAKMSQVPTQASRIENDLILSVSANRREKNGGPIQAAIWFEEMCR
jgi:hypothetical protein